MLHKDRNQKAMKSECLSGHMLHINCICFVCLFAAEVHGTENPLTGRPPLNPWIWQKTALEQYLQDRRTRMKINQRVSQVRVKSFSYNLATGKQFRVHFTGICFCRLTGNLKYIGSMSDIIGSTSYYKSYEQNCCIYCNLPCSSSA